MTKQDTGGTSRPPSPVTREEIADEMRQASADWEDGPLGDLEINSLLEAILSLFASRASLPATSRPLPEEIEEIEKRHAHAEAAYKAADDLNRVDELSVRFGPCAHDDRGDLLCYIRASLPAGLTEEEREAIDYLKMEARDKEWDAEMNTTGEQQRLYRDQAKWLRTALSLISRPTASPPTSPEKEG